MFTDSFPVIHSDDTKVVGKWAEGVSLLEVDDSKVSARRDAYMQESIALSKARENGGKAQQEAGTSN